MKVLVYGASGAQMGSATEVLIAQGYQIRVFTRSEEKARSWQAKGAEAFIGDMSDYAMMRQASEGCDAIFLLIPTFRDSDETGAQFGLNAIQAAQQTGITKVVWNTAGPVPEDDAEEAKTSANGQVLRKLKENSMSYLGLQPVTYMENLFGPWNTERLTYDVVSYPTPLDFRMQWVAARDFGVIAAAALKEKLPNKIFHLGGPSAMNGQDLTDIFSKCFGRSLTYETTTVETFKTYLKQHAGEAVAHLISGLYAAIQAAPDNLQPSFLTDASAVESRFGVKLTSFEDWLILNRGMFAQFINEGD